MKKGNSSSTSHSHTFGFSFLHMCVIERWLSNDKVILHKYDQCVQHHNKYTANITMKQQQWSHQYICKIYL
jgi:hypothetical protein